ncbi:MAG: hypothetical protein P0116_13065 [Candidatus Nitrosocosmicus sp.]|nr:hypothetical protein [Candidatus Nitrosocosmicus sp.]
MIKKFNLSVNKPVKGLGDKIVGENECNVKIVKEAEEDSCSCCSADSEFSQVSQSIGSMMEKSNLEKLEIKERLEKKEDKQSKILILIGLTLTIPLVTLELLEFYDIIEESFIFGYLLLFLATPIQILLGRPFYKRFYNSIKKRKSFTVDTLVVLSTSVAYVYSVIALITNQDVIF